MELNAPLIKSTIVAALGGLHPAADHAQDGGAVALSEVDDGLGHFEQNLNLGSGETTPSHAACQAAAYCSKR